MLLTLSYAVKDFFLELVTLLIKYFIGILNMVIILYNISKIYLEVLFETNMFYSYSGESFKVKPFFIISVINLPETCTLNQIFSKVLNIVTNFLFVVICLKEISTLYNKTVIQ